MKVLADTMGISKASGSRCVHNVSNCLCDLATEWISFPTAPEDINVNIYDITYMKYKFLFFVNQLFTRVNR